METNPFCRRLLQARQTRQLTQEQLASQVGISISSLTQIESGAESPTLDTAAKLADALRVSLDYLAGAKAAPVNPWIELRLMPGKGRGTIAIQPIAQGTVIERAPAASFPASERATVDQTLLGDYYFVPPAEYRPDHKFVEGHFVLGLSSISNHAEDHNARMIWTKDECGVWGELTAIRDIAEGEEVTIFYTNIDEYPVEQFV